MAIQQVPFDNEKELQEWVVENITAFVPGAIHIPGCQVTTVSGKSGVPDGFAFDFKAGEWYVIENEILGHGVWPHIAEQVVRFVVGMQNPESRRKVRDRLFDALLETDRLEDVAGILGATVERALQQIELFIEGTPPHVAIFIDDTNRDLEDMAHALVAQTKIFRVQKFLVNGQREYYSPDRNIPIVETEREETGVAGETDYELVELLGGGELEGSVRRFRCYKLADGSIIHMKRSKYHAKDNYYWYGISPSELGHCDEFGVSYLVFVMGEEGLVKVPVQTVKEFISNTQASRDQDGNVRHYHCLISPGPEPELYWSSQVPKFALGDYYLTF